MCELSESMHVTKGYKVWDSYYIYSGESRGGDIIITKLNRRKKRPLYFFNNKSPYINSSDDIKNQTIIYSINA